MITFASQKQKKGALAHLARAFDWQSRGGEFESRMLHKKLNRPNTAALYRDVAVFVFFYENPSSIKHYCVILH